MFNRQVDKLPTAEEFNEWQMALKADAERLAELKREYHQATYLTQGTPARVVRRLEALIAVHEECAARGIAFGGGR